MSLPIDLPLDVVSRIIDELRGDADALKCCSLTARSFTRFSHQHLFSTIEVNRLIEACRLHELLTSSTHIRYYIRMLAFSIRRSIYDWEILMPEALPAAAEVLRMLPRLQILKWGDVRPTAPGWRDLPADLRSAFVDMFQSQILTTVQILGPRDIPCSVLRKFTHVQNLRLIHLNIHNDEPCDAPPICFPSLKTLELYVLHPPTAESYQLQFSTPNLFCLSFSESIEVCRRTAQQTLKSAGDSVERVIWSYVDMPLHCASWFLFAALNVSCKNHS